MQKILVVEDDWEMNQGICYVLEANGYGVVSAYSIKEGRKTCEENGVDLVLLDVNLPDGQGFELCRWIRRHARVPVLFLSARDLEEDVLKGYEMGAEDYVTKPFPMSVFQKKVSALLARIRKQSGGDFYNDGNLFINFTEMTATLGGETDRKSVV